jgi:hypothetical protein
MSVKEAPRFFPPAGATPNELAASGPASPAALEWQTAHAAAATAQHVAESTATTESEERQRVLDADRLGPVRRCFDRMQSAALAECDATERALRVKGAFVGAVAYTGFKAWRGDYSMPDYSMPPIGAMTARSGRPAGRSPASPAFRAAIVRAQKAPTVRVSRDGVLPIVDTAPPALPETTDGPETSTAIVPRSEVRDGVLDIFPRPDIVFDVVKDIAIGSIGGYVAVRLYQAARGPLRVAYPPELPTAVEARLRIECPDAEPWRVAGWCSAWRDLVAEAEQAPAAVAAAPRIGGQAEHGQRHALARRAAPTAAHDAEYVAAMRRARDVAPFVAIGAGVLKMALRGR